MREITYSLLTLGFGLGYLLTLFEDLDSRVVVGQDLSHSLDLALSLVHHRAKLSVCAITVTAFC